MTPIKRILIATDGWKPQTNGIVTTVERVIEECQRRGIEVEIIHPELGYWSVPFPFDPEVKLPLFAYKDVAKRIRDFRPDAIHIISIATISLFARKYCLKNSIPFTASYHTQFPEYITKYVPFIPHCAGYAAMRSFYNKSTVTMVATETMKTKLIEEKLTNVELWPLGVDLELFHPSKREFHGENVFAKLPKPIWLNVGRLAVEKNLDAFFKLDLPGTKVSIGYGPLLNKMKKQYPDVVFLGPLYGEELARHMADADVFVFPSFTDTLGLVNIESLACGTPIASYVAPGPIDILAGSEAGVMNEDLKTACEKALKISRQKARKHAENFSWQHSVDEFIKHLKILTEEEKSRL